MGVGHEVDRAFAAAASAAAARVMPEPGDKSFLEKRLAATLGAALEAELPSHTVVLNKKVPAVVIDEWQPQPGNFDLSLLDRDGAPVALAELKLDDVEQTLWDMLKLASALRVPSVQTAYMVTAAPATVWKSNREVVELYREPETEQWSTRFFFSKYRHAWTSLLRGGVGRPLNLPATIFVLPLVTVAVAGYPPYELRVIRIARGDGGISLVSGWPSPKTHEDELLDDELTPADLPAPDAPSQHIHRFALTTNGYDRMGTHARCAALANGAVERWRETGELPQALGDLRCCLFFEQRRWYHYGYDFDERALAYVRALIEAMRPFAADR